MDIAFWGGAAIVLLAVEAATYGLTSVWFAIGALCALLTAVLGAPPWLQAVWFAVVSAATLLLTRPLVKKYINSRTQPTNADRLLGQTALVREDVDNLAGSGAVFADGKLWTARSAGGQRLPSGSRVRIERIEGVKLIVSPAAPEQSAGPGGEASPQNE